MILSLNRRQAGGNLVWQSIRMYQTKILDKRLELCSRLDSRSKHGPKLNSREASLSKQIMKQELYQHEFRRAYYNFVVEKQNLAGLELYRSDLYSCALKPGRRSTSRKRPYAISERRLYPSRRGWTSSDWSASLQRR